MIIAGIDEAGYGPLLGPLVVSATAFEVDGRELDSVDAADLKTLPCLWKMMKSAVAKKAPAKKGRVLVADSKVVHAQADGVKLLERGVLAFVGTLEEAVGPLDGVGLMKLLGCVDHELEAHPWYPRSGGAPLPWLGDPGDLAIARNMLQGAMAAAHVRTVCMRTAVVSERAFNRLVDGTRNKASALISVTFRHLHYLHHAFGERGLLVAVDKQGGRDYYRELLMRSFPDASLKVLEESGKSSAYALTENTAAGTRGSIIFFREKGDGLFFATALASMICKYLREWCMHAFNAWWCGQIAGLRPTAGYYGDGSRWLVDVEPHLERLGIAREMLVRVR